MEFWGFMKVAYFIGSLNRGGTEMLTLDICRRHREAPYQILLVYRNEGELSEQYRQTGVRMIRLKPSKGGRLAYLFEMRRMLKREQVDVLHAQTLTNGAFALFCTLFTNIKVVNTFHGFHTSWAAMPMCHLVMAGCDALCFVSDYERRWYANHSIERRNGCFVVYNGIDFSKFDGIFEEPDFFKKIDAAQPRKDLLSSHDSAKRIRLAMIGNFVSGRSQNSLLRCIHLLYNHGYKNFDFYFVGKRAYHEPWLYDDCVKYVEQNALEGCVHFVGSRGDVPAILQHIDAFVYSTAHDTFGIAVVEAMAAGVPVVANDWEVMKEISQNGKWLRLYKTDDAQSGAEAMADLIDNISAYKAAAQQQKHEVRSTFSIENHIERLASIYSAVVSNNKKEMQLLSTR